MLNKYRVGVCMMGFMYNKGCDFVEYDWCSRFLYSVSHTDVIVAKMRPGKGRV